MHDSLILIQISNNDCDCKSIMLHNGIIPNETINVSSGKELVTTLAYSVKKYRNIVVVGGVKGKLQNTVDTVARATGLTLLDISDEADATHNNSIFRMPKDSDAVTMGGINYGCRIEKSNQVIIMLTDDEKPLGKIIPAAAKNGFFVSIDSMAKQKAAMLTTAGASASAATATSTQESYDDADTDDYDDYDDDINEAYNEEARPPRLIKPLGKGNDDAVNLDEVFGTIQSNKYVYKKRGSWITKLIVVFVILALLATGLYVFYQKAGAGLISDFVFSRVNTIYKESMANEDKFANLSERNEDFAGWVKISQTGVNFPVMMSSEYADTTFFKFKNRYGTPYLADSASLGYENKNLTVYGTNLDGERVFAPLESYRELSYYKSHPIISFDTKYGDGTYMIFSVMLLDDNDSFDVSKNQFGDGEFYDFITELNQRSLILTTVGVDTDSELLTLTTELDDFDGARIAIVARKVLENESAVVDTDGAIKNPSAVIPARFAGQSEYQTATPEPTTTITTATTTPTTLMTIPITTASKATESSTSTTAVKITSKKETEVATTQNAGEIKITTKSTTQPTTTTATTKPTTTEPPQSTTTTATTTKATQKPTQPTSTTTTQPTTTNGGGGEGDKSDTPKIRFSANGTVYYKDRTEVIARIVQAEIGNNAPIEAMKAQAITAYSYIKAKQNGNPNATVSGMAYYTGTLSQTCLEAAKAVDGIAVKYNGKYAPLYCFAISAGKTAWGSDTWGGSNYPYTSSVDSSVDASVNGFHTTKTFTSAELAKILNEYLDFDINTVTDKNQWVVITELDNNGLYAKRVCIGGKKTVYGESFRCYAMQYKIRSHCFTVTYNSDNDTFTFDVKGWGHGVGLSQDGAIQYAKQGKDYKWILDHYFNINSSGSVYVKD